MFKKVRNKIQSYKQSKLKTTLGENVRDYMIKSSLEAAYAAGNSTEKVGEVASQVGALIDGGTSLIGGTEASSSLGKIAFKTVKDIGRGDAVCTGLCCISAGCESIALGCSIIKAIPFRGKLYTSAKIISKGCMAYRNLCASEGC